LPCAADRCRRLPRERFRSLTLNRSSEASFLWQPSLAEALEQMLGVLGTLER
jgi:hypothetical protein